MDGTALLLVAALVVALFVYFLPTGIAQQRRHRERTPIFLLNLLLGWTFMGWVAAFVWSLTSNVEPSGPLEEHSFEPETLPAVTSGERDPLFPRAVALCVQHQAGSTSLLQRHFNIGYIRAARLIDELEAAGIVGPLNTAGLREVLIRPEPHNG